MKDLRERLRSDRPMTTISLRMPEDVVTQLKHVAPLLGFSGYQPLIRAYIGQGLRQDLERLEQKLSQEAAPPTAWSREEIYGNDGR
jgi:hypothetical protein